MSDLINRQDAIDAINSLPDCPNGYSDTYDKACIIGVIEDIPSAEWEVAYIQDFVQYQVDWLTEHDDLELEPKLEGWVIRFLQDTASCYQAERRDIHIAVNAKKQR